MLKIAVIGGDGTGPEVIAEAVKTLKVVEKKYNIQCQFDPFDFGATRFLKTGEILSDQEVNHLKQYDAMLLGAIGHPEAPPGVLERGILLKLRFDLDQYINLRPIKLYPNVNHP